MISSGWLAASKGRRSGTICWKVEISIKIIPDSVRVHCPCRIKFVIKLADVLPLPVVRSISDPFMARFLPVNALVHRRAVYRVSRLSMLLHPLRTYVDQFNIDREEKSESS